MFSNSYLMFIILKGIIIIIGFFLLTLEELIPYSAHGACWLVLGRIFTVPANSPYRPQQRPAGFTGAGHCL